MHRVMPHLGFIHPPFLKARKTAGRKVKSGGSKSIEPQNMMVYYGLIIITFNNYV